MWLTLDKCQVEVHYQCPVQPQTKEGSLYKKNHERLAASCHEIICVCLRKYTDTYSSDKTYKLWRTMNDLSQTSTDKEINYLVIIKATCHELDVVNFVVDGSS